MKSKTKLDKMEADLLKYINDEPILFSLLYDLDLLPEQLSKKSLDWAKLLIITQHFKIFAKKHS